MVTSQKTLRTGVEKKLLRVVELDAAGKTNKQISLLLFREGLKSQTGKGRYTIAGISALKKRAINMGIEHVVSTGNVLKGTNIGTQRHQHRRSHQ